jgi:hypothetical protein
MTLVSIKGEIVEVVGVEELIQMGAYFLEHWPNKDKIAGGRKISDSQNPIFEVFVQDFENPKKCHGFRGFGQIGAENWIPSGKAFLD